MATSPDATQQPQTFVNPVLSGFNPDPSVVRVGNDFFLATSTFEYFPGVPLYHSRDLVNWRLIGHALTRKSQLEMRTVETGGGIWAPTLRCHDGYFYLATCKWDRYRPQSDERIFPRGFYVRTNNIWDDSTWSDPIFFDNPGFDQDLFWDDDGKVYLSTTVRMTHRPLNSKQKDFAIHVSEINLDTGATLTAPQVIRASPLGLAEGSHIIKRAGFYYLFTAEGGTESAHQEWVLRSTNGPLGPWELGPRNPLWYNGPGEDVQNTGHVDVFEDANGQWWAVLLGVRARLANGHTVDSQLGRETFLVTVDWEDNWPVFDKGKNISILTIGRGNMATKTQEKTWVADLSHDTLELGWYHKNTPLKPFHTLTARSGYLRIHGGCYDLSSPEAPTMLLRKQTSYTQTFRATLDFTPSRSGYEAGVAIWWSIAAYASISVRLAANGNGREVHVRLPGAAEEATHPLTNPSSSITFTISASPQHYTIHYQQHTHDSTPIPATKSPIPAAALTTAPKFGASYTGMMFGLYAFGRNEPCLTPADFSAVEIISL